MKCVVTGGAGFIGSHIVDALVSRGDEVVVIDDLSEGFRENLKQAGEGAKLVVDTILNPKVLENEFQDADVIFHQAALRSVPKSVDDPLSYNQVNINGTYQVLEAARKRDVGRVVFASSSSVYGDGHELPLRESYYPMPRSPYALSKLAGENYLFFFTETYGIETVGLRYFNVFGPRQPPGSQYSAVIPIFIKRVMEDKPPIIYGTGEQSRDFTYVANIVKANLLAAETKRCHGEIFNVADGEAITVNELASAVISHFGKKLRPEYAPKRQGDVLHTLADLSKTKEGLGYESEVGFHEGLKHTLAWFENTT